MLNTNKLKYTQHPFDIDIDADHVDNADEQKIIQDPETHIRLDMGLDTEFETDKNLSVQMCFRGLYENTDLSSTFVVIDNFFSKEYSEEMLEKISLEIKGSIFFDDLNSEKPIIIEYLASHLENKLDLHKPNYLVTVNLYMFYSMKDLLIGFSKQIMIPFLLGTEGNLKQRRNISGMITHTHCYIGKNAEKQLISKKLRFTFIIKDLFGVDSGSLADVARSCGFDTSKKTSLDKYKSQMSLAIKNEPYLFITYGVFDAEILFKIIDSKVLSANKILKDILHIEKIEEMYSSSNYPTTVGAFVFSLWQKFYKYNVIENNEMFLMASCKQSVLNPESPYYENCIQALDDFSELKNLADLQQIQKENPEKYKLFQEFLLNKQVIKYAPQEALSIQYLVEHSRGTTTALLSLVSGGRSVNEKPEIYSHEYTADVDIGGAYAGQLISTIYPVGRPRLIAYTTKQKKNTLGDILDRYYCYFEPGLFKIIVSGFLPFQQDLIYSKLITLSKLQAQIGVFLTSETKDPDEAYIEAPFVLLRQEIQNGVLTFDLIEALKKICSNEEWGFIRKLQVQAAAYFDIRDKVNTITELTDFWIQESGSYEYNTKFQNIVEDRSYKWYPLPIKNLINPLVETRRTLKKSKDPLDQSLQNSLKLIVNTVYGLLCSRFFPKMSNVVCADNITAATRLNVWYISKALNTMMSITDGGPYSLMEVFFLKKHLKSFRKPSLNTLSNLLVLENHPYISKKPLAEINWKYGFETKQAPHSNFFKDLDDLVLKHVEEFWYVYGIKIHFIIEHKKDNLAVKAATLSKAHYGFLIYDLKENDYVKMLFKIRGSRIIEGLKPNPTFELLKAILSNQDFFVFEPNYEDLESIKLNGWKRSLKDRTNAYTSSIKQNVFPGDFYVKTKHFILKNGFIRLLTAKEYYTIANRKTHRIRIKTDGTKYIEICQHFEKFLPLEGIQKTYKRMNHNLIRKTKYDLRANIDIGFEDD